MQLVITVAWPIQEQRSKNDNENWNSGNNNQKLAYPFAYCVGYDRRRIRRRRVDYRKKIMLKLVVLRNLSHIESDRHPHIQYEYNI